MYSRGRIDALTDGVFAVAMTLLVIDIRPPEDVSKAEEFIKSLVSLEPKLVAYIISFFVVGMSWLTKATTQKRPEVVGRHEAMLTLLYLFLVTLTPFSTILLSSASDLLPAIWIYCANMGALGLVAIAIHFTHKADPEGSIISPSLLTLASVIGAIDAYYGSKTWAMAYLMISASPIFMRHKEKKCQT